MPVDHKRLKGLINCLVGRGRNIFTLDEVWIYLKDYSKKDIFTAKNMKKKVPKPGTYSSKEVSVNTERTDKHGYPFQITPANVLMDIRHLAVQYEVDVALAGGRTPQLSCERT
ncbi:hypothetical protein TNCV_1248521 [Trichonephila clavipes]|nr:hypothetical protein TNCV_1248521 [Trichonephila clavipes]